MKCIYHPGRDASGHSHDGAYCAQCHEAMRAAAAQVDGHVAPKPCFIWYRGGGAWAPITGTGCAHWVAHEKGMGGGSGTCLEGKILKVVDLVRGKPRIEDPNQARVGDLFVTDDLGHCGLVERIRPFVGHPPSITIRHCSSRQRRVAINDWADYFGGRGKFHRMPGV